MVSVRYTVVKSQNVSKVNKKKDQTLWFSRIATEFITRTLQILNSIKRSSFLMRYDALAV